MRKLILRSFQSPGDIVVLSAAIRELHLAHPGQFQTDVRTSADAVWENNPYLTPLREGDANVEVLTMHYPLIHQSNQRPYHFIHGYVQYLEQQLDVRIPVTQFRGDVYLSQPERESAPVFEGIELPERFWIVIAGGKYDFTAKWWNPEAYQQVVDHFQGRIQFVQCGEGGHWHPRLQGVTDLVGRTSLREFIHLMHYAEGVLCPVTLAMHLAAAVETRPDRAKLRPCVVVAGGREPPHWEAYPGQQYLSTVGMLDCCADGGCWKSRCQLVGDGDRKDRHDVCVHPIDLTTDLRIPACMDMISADDVIRSIEMYEGNVPHGPVTAARRTAERDRLKSAESKVGDQHEPLVARQNGTSRVLVAFSADNADIRDKAVVLKHLVHYHPDWSIDVALSEQQYGDLSPLCPQATAVIDVDCDRHQYDRILDVPWQPTGIDYPQWPNTPATGCLFEQLKLTPIPDLFDHEAGNGRHIPFPNPNQEQHPMPAINSVPGDPIAPLPPARNSAISTVLDDQVSGQQSTVKSLQPTEKIGIKFRHGLGDAVQLGIVLKHLRVDRPAWEVDVLALRGKHSALHGLCRHVYHDQEPQPDESAYDHVFDLEWHEQNHPRGDHPSTKASRCLLEVFGIEPDPALFTYDIQVGDAARTRTAKYLASICGDRRASDGRFPVLLLHYEGNTSQREKNLSHATAEAVCQAAIGNGLVPVILDWDGRSPLPDQKRIFRPHTGPGDIWGGFGSGDAEALAALIEQSALMIGVDSGPLHVAGATTTPTIGVWTGHFPPQYFDLAGNVTHFVPQNWTTLGFAKTAATTDYFRREYSHRVYQNLASELVAEINARTSAEPESNLIRYGDFWIRRDNVEQDLVIVRDIFEEDAYQTRLLSDNAGPQVVVDVGSHIGCFAKRWHQKNPQARIICVEACPENLEALRANVGDFAEVVHAACTYETEPVALLNAVRPDCESTGGSVVVPRDQIETSDLRQPGYQYWHDLRELPTVTLEDLMQRFGFDHIDVLKLDCEGSEFSILGESPSLDRIHIVVGEYHGRRRWDEFRKARLADWNYGHMHDGGENGGLFHLANTTWPPVSSVVHSGQQAEPADKYIRKVREIAMAADREFLPLWEPYHRTLFQVVSELQPSRVVEIGVRAGYSGLAFLMSNPAAEVWGYDIADQPASQERFRHAERLFADCNYHLIQVDSHALEELPVADLVFIDGDHSYAGCTADLRLAAQATDTILVDDYGAGPTVRPAVDDFLKQHGSEFRARRIDFRNGNGGAEAMLLLQRRSPLTQPMNPLIQPPLLRVAVPAGIGDSVWSLMKIPDMLAAYGADKAHVALCGGPPHRAQSFVERFDFVASVENSDWICVEQPPYTPAGVYNWAPSGVGWHNEFDWMLQANRHLENGQRLETWLPEFDTAWDIADRFSFTGREVRQARELAEQIGPYCVFYLGPELGNTTAGHNRGPLWTPAEWGRLADHCRVLGLKIVVVGAEYDRSYFEQHVANCLGDCYDAIGKWPIGQTFAVIQRSRFVIAYQSGVGIFSVYMGVPAAVFWRPHGNSIDPAGYVSFQEDMSSAWAPPGTVDSGQYLPSIYTRCSPDSIAEHARQHNWHKSN